MILTDTQQKIIDTKGNLVVRASAGTGKTHTMVNKIIKEIKENRTHKVIAAITFTIKAAQEIKDRLTVETSEHFIGTNNSFVIEEVIKPFMKDVYGEDFDIDIDTDYGIKVESFEEGIQKVIDEGILCAYSNNRKNFIFQLGQQIVENSKACRLYLQAKYFKIYIDEYQDCDSDMHAFFMYLCEQLGIETFIVGDEKQSIYIWRGAYPEAFKSIYSKENFNKIFMADNFRSCKQIQNYSNLLFEETRELYIETKSNNIIWIDTNNEIWPQKVREHIDDTKKTALLRFSNDNAQLGASALSNYDIEFVYIPQLPIADIINESAWLYSSIAKNIILEQYSVYDFISEIPAEGERSKRNINQITTYLKSIEMESKQRNMNKFEEKVMELSNYLGYNTKIEHIGKLYKTIIDKKLHVAFEPEKYHNIAITFHSSKGLEFDQVIVFAEDYRLNDVASIYNHYVAVTRAKTKLIIVKINNYNANLFQMNLKSIFQQNNVQLEDVICFNK
jgi:superfamily I DNA/RNA helicase